MSASRCAWSQLHFGIRLNVPFKVWVPENLPIESFRPWGLVIPADTQIQGQLGSNLPIVLYICALIDLRRGGSGDLRALSPGCVSKEETCHGMSRNRIVVILRGDTPFGCKGKAATRCHVRVVAAMLVAQLQRVFAHELLQRHRSCVGGISSIVHIPAPEGEQRPSHRDVRRSILRRTEQVENLRSEIPSAGIDIDFAARENGRPDNAATEVEDGGWRKYPRVIDRAGIGVLCGQVHRLKNAEPSLAARNAIEVRNAAMCRMFAVPVLIEAAGPTIIVERRGSRTNEVSFVVGARQWSAIRIGIVAEMSSTAH